MASNHKTPPFTRLVWTTTSTYQLLTPPRAHPRITYVMMSLSLPPRSALLLLTADQGHYRSLTFRLDSSLVIHRCRILSWRCRLHALDRTLWHKVVFGMVIHHGSLPALFFLFCISSSYQSMWRILWPLRQWKLKTFYHGVSRYPAASRFLGWLYSYSAVLCSWS